MLPASPTRLEKPGTDPACVNAVANVAAAQNPDFNTSNTDLKFSEFDGHREALPSGLEARLRLNFHSLSGFEPVTLQFEPRGVVFDGAIALSPSNPRFISESGQTVLVPTHRDHYLQIELAPLVKQICLWGRSTRPIVLEAFDASGKAVCTQTGIAAPAAPSQDTGRLPAQVFKLTQPGAKLRLSAKAPFTLEGMAV